MPIPRARPITFRPTGLSDTADATNAFPGAMASLANLIPDPTTDRSWVCRPAATAVPGFPGSLQNPGFQSGMLVVGNIMYGLLASGLNPGYDQPFAFNLASGAFLTVNGVTAANVPASPMAIGDWTPPILAQVGSRILVTHPGFPGGAVKFGWFDVTGFSAMTTGDTNSSTTITGNPTILGVQPGMTIAGSGIPASATVVSAAPFVLDTTGTTHGTATLDSLASTTGVSVGQTVAGSGIPTGTTVASINSSTSITMSQDATASASGVAVTFGGATITLSTNATATANGVSLTIAGGTPSSPLWGAGDTNLNPLPSVPLGVAQFNARAYFACGTNGIPFSDAGVPCQISNNPAVQVLATNDGLAVTAIGPLLLGTPLTGGIVQALIAFEGANKMQQITGDPTTGNLQMNALPVATGTLAPLSVTPFSQGLSFISPQGLRYINVAGQVTPPIGAAGQGISAPFINCPHPSRIATAANVDVLRISVPPSTPSGSPQIEYWYDLTRKTWNGPHSFAASLIQPWGTTFAASLTGTNGLVFQSDAYQAATSTYTENGTALSWTWQPSPLPDNNEVSMNALVRSALTCALNAGQFFNLSATDMNGTALDTTSIYVGGASTTWGQFVWGGAVWGSQLSPYQQRHIGWHVPLVFKQLSIAATGTSSNGIRLGNLYMLYEVLGYTVEQVAPGPQPFYQLLSDEGVPLSSDTGVPETPL